MSSFESIKSQLEKPMSIQAEGRDEAGNVLFADEKKVPTEDKYAAEASDRAVYENTIPAENQQEIVHNGHMQAEGTEEEIVSPEDSQCSEHKADYQDSQEPLRMLQDIHSQSETNTAQLTRIEKVLGNLMGGVKRKAQVQTLPQGIGLSNELEEIKNELSKQNAYISRSLNTIEYYRQETLTGLQRQVDSYRKMERSVYNLPLLTAIAKVLSDNWFLISQAKDSDIKKNLELFFEDLEAIIEDYGIRRVKQTKPGDNFSPRFSARYRLIPTLEKTLEGKVAESVKPGYMMQINEEEPVRVLIREAVDTYHYQASCEKEDEDATKIRDPEDIEQDIGGEDVT